MLAGAHDHRASAQTGVLTSQGPRPGWIETLYTQRSEPEGELTPSLRPRVEQALSRLYAQARRNTARALETYGEHAAAAALPETCPYTLDQSVGDWLP